MRLNEKLILKWAEDHLERTGRWPIIRSGRVIGAPPHWNLNWRRVDYALTYGGDGLAAGKTLARFLECRKPFWFYLRRFSDDEIVQCIREHHRRTGRWPQRHLKTTAGSSGRTWMSIDAMLKRDSRANGTRKSLTDLIAVARGALNPRNLPPLTVNQVLAWADSFHRTFGRWPQKQKDATVSPATGESWAAIDAQLRRGGRGLQTTDGLPNFLERYRNVRNVSNQPPITVSQILAWADHHHERTGQWPQSTSGAVHGQANEDWSSLNGALMFGRRGLRTRDTLARFLARHRGKRHPKELPRLTPGKILRWADGHFEKTGAWPLRTSGNVLDQPDDNWASVDESLRAGQRGLPRGSSLIKLLTQKRKRFSQTRGIPLKKSDVLEWAAQHHELTGHLPTVSSGQVRGQIGETWKAIDASLRFGARSLRGGSSLAELLDSHYIPAHDKVGCHLSTPQIIRWAESFKQRVGRWPTKESAFTDSSRREKWAVIEVALREGYRGLPGGSSLAKLLAEHRSRRRAAIAT